MASLKCINDLLASSSSNVRTRQEMNIGDGSFKLKSALINMVQQSPIYGKASEDVNVHLQHFLDICSIFTIQGVTQNVVRLCLFPFSLLEKTKQWFYSNKLAVSTWEKCSNAFLAKFFSVGQDQCPLEQDLYLSTSQGCHISCNKFPNRTGNRNLWVW
jgi:hypothetical protein